MASEVTDEELKQKMRELINGCDISQTTTKTIRKQLERELGCDLKARKKEITQIMQSIIIETQEESEEHSAEEDGEIDGESTLPALTLIELPNTGSRGRAPKKPKKPSTSSIQLSEELMNFLGTDDAGMPRKEVLARIRQYMKDQGLPKDPRDGRKTVLDLPLQQLFKVKTVTAININKYLSKHMKRWMNETVEEEEEADSYDDVIESPPAKKSPKKTKAPQKKTATKRKRKNTGGDDDGSEEKKKKKPGGFAKVQYHLSPELAAVVGAKTMARPQIVSKLWVYIKANDLQNPKNKKEIFCDDLLEKALGHKKVTMFSMNKVVGNGILDKV